MHDSLCRDIHSIIQAIERATRAFSARRDVVTLGLPILFADDHLVVVDKPSGLLVHRGGWGDDDVVAMTLARDAVGRHVYPVHRLDRATSGALVFALDSSIARFLHEAFESGAV